jgi:hypothetical protein
LLSPSEGPTLHSKTGTTTTSDEERLMATVVATHAVGNMDTWLAGGADRKALFAGFCKSHRIFRHPEKAEVAIVFEGADLAKMKEVLDSPQTEAAKARHTVVEPVLFYVEVEGGS